VNLMLNGKSIYEQTGKSRARCLLSPSQLRKGRNELYWQAEWQRENEHLQARTASQNLNKETGLEDGFIPQTLVYTAEDSAWTEESRTLLNYKNQKNDPHFAFYQNRAVMLDLGPSIQGGFDVAIQARADAFGGPGEIQATLVAGERRIPIGKCSYDGRWSFRNAGRVDLPPGPKQLHIAFINDLYDKEKKGDRNAFVSAVHLMRTRPADKTAPTVKMLYPPPDHSMHGTDALVAEVLENDRIRKVEVLIDGKPQPWDPPPASHGGPMVFPLLLRGLSPGPHQVELAVTDQAGNTSTTPPLSLQVLAMCPPNPGPYARAIRLLQRFAYGPEPSQLAQILVQGETAWLRGQLEAAPVFCHDPAAHPNDTDGNQLRARILRHHLETPNPVQSRLLNWIENHFSTWERKTGLVYEYQEHLRFAGLGNAPFREYLAASATSPSMLYYLDQQNSFSGRINENYAREILELHTLGVKGGYTQQDVTSLARLLTGWTLAQEGSLDGTGRNLIRTFRFIPKMNDPLDEQKPTPILGWPFLKTPPEGREERIRLALDLAADHPSTAHFISSKLIHHYHLMPAPPELEEEISETFARSGGDLTEVLRHIARHPSFWDPQARPRLATPLDFSIRLSRLVGETNPGSVSGFLDRSGTGLYDRATPDGYPEEDEAYADSNALLQRWRFAQELENRIFQLLPRAWRNPREGESEEAYLTRVIDCYAIRLTGNLLSERSQQATLVLAQTSKLRPEETLKLIGVFICQLPEASLR
jgi:hypothetical protein